MTKKKTMTKTMRYRIAFEKELYTVLDEITFQSNKIKNLATTRAHDWQDFSFNYHSRFGKYPKVKDLTGYALLTSDIDQHIKEVADFQNMSSEIRAGSIREAVRYYQNWMKEIWKGNRTIPTYRRNGSFPLRAKLINDIKKSEKNGMYSATLALLSREGAKLLNRKGRFEVELFGSRKNKSINQIIERVISGEYKLSDSKIVKNKKGQYELLMAYTFEKQEVITDENKVMGVDLGIAVPATISVSDDDWYYQFVGSAQEVRDFEKQVNSRRIRLSKARKWAGEGSVGRGRNTRMNPVDKLGNKIANFKDTKNHQWSKYIVDEAVRLGVGLIQLEDLEGVSKNSNKKENLFLKSWTFYDLAEKITYKANEFGIKVVKVKPNYTSSRCSHCGFIHKDVEKELWRPTQDQFKCINCDYGTKRFVNADVNASRNLAIRDIDKIIAAELKEIEKTKKRLEKLN